MWSMRGKRIYRYSTKCLRWHNFDIYRGRIIIIHFRLYLPTSRGRLRIAKLRIAENKCCVKSLIINSKWNVYKYFFICSQILCLGLIGAERRLMLASPSYGGQLSLSSAKFPRCETAHLFEYLIDHQSYFRSMNRKKVQTSPRWRNHLTLHGQTSVATSQSLNDLFAHLVAQGPTAEIDSEDLSNVCVN